MKGISLYR